MYRVGIVVVGDELVTGRKGDTNGPWLASECIRLGHSCIKITIVPDDIAVITEAIRSFNDIEWVFVSGGLGPTHDDVTRESLCNFIGSDEALVIDEDALRSLNQKFKSDGRIVSENNIKQAMRPQSSEILLNENGTASGILVRNNLNIVAMPGPPSELRPMFKKYIQPLFAMNSSNSKWHISKIHVWGIAESEAGMYLEKTIEKFPSIKATITSSPSRGLIILLSLFGNENEKLILSKVALDLKTKWDPYSFNEQSLCHAVSKMLIERMQTLSVAESCTGGLLGCMCTELSGSSQWFNGGFITYSNESKQKLLGVSKDLLKKHGAVSEDVVIEMASGSAKRTDSKYSIAISGIAGPTGETDSKPIGTVWIALHVPEGTRSFRFLFPGNREEIRQRAANTALQLLRFELLKKDFKMLWLKECNS